MKKLFAEFFGTFWLVLGGCGTAVFAAPHVGFLGVALAFGLTVLTMAYAVGHISGGHFNPAVSLGLFAGGRFPAKDLIPYIIVQVLGAIAAAAVLYFALISSNKEIGGFAANGYAALSPDHYTLCSVFLVEFVLTAFFLIVIMGATDKFANGKFAGIAIGLALTLIHLISIPVSNTSVNPARSLSQAIFAGGDYLSQVWVFWLAPLLGGAAGGLIYKYLLQRENLDNE
ncbi:MAG: aquaporin Z [Flavobacteriaceae bacterium]|jgi:aquaporin Z|nr:aquaporin Z [Flavobacteriaceae bacterium]